MDSNIIIKFGLVLEVLNTKQRMIANQLFHDSENSFLDHNGEFLIKTKDGVYNFFEYVKSKCNCG
jgi:hypothetical protein